MTARRANPVEAMAEGILDVLADLEGERVSAVPGRVITKLAALVVGYDVAYGDPEYHTCSRAILFLEELELVRVGRLYERRAQRANLLTHVELNQGDRK